MIDYNIISTGSQGNAVVIEHKILIDCGVSFKALAAEYRTLKLVLLTHIHSDHFHPSTLRLLASNRPTLRFACCAWLCKPLVDAGVPVSQIDVLDPGHLYGYGICNVIPHMVKHNVPNCGWKVWLDGRKLFYCTDMNNLNGISAPNYDLYMVEANYDDKDIQAKIAEKKLTGEYSNLADSDTQALLSNLLQNAGVSDLRIQTFFDHVQKFNNAVDPAWLTTGFENAKPLDLKYDPYSMQDAWTEKYDTFPGWNCRITACGLFGDFITVTGKADLDSAEDTLFMDYETLDSDPESLCGDERQKFDALFAPVKTTNTTDIPTHLKTIQQEWKKRGLSFIEDDKIRLVSVVLHDQFSETDNSLMIGHVGVMLPTSDAVYFVEKVAFQEPYRLLKFKNRTELSDYLMLKYDNSWGQDTAHTFILENSDLMDGWRILEEQESTVYKGLHRVGI